MKRNLLAVIILSAVTGFASSCSKDGAGDSAPVISQLSIAPNTVRSGFSKDTVFVTFTVNDKNADLGRDIQNKEFDIYMRDSRDLHETGFPFPSIPEEIKDPSKGLTAITTVKLNAALFLQTRQDHLEGDTLHYEIYVMDKAGNKSNVLTTSDIYILPL